MNSAQSKKSITIPCPKCGKNIQEDDRGEQTNMDFVCPNCGYFAPADPASLKKVFAELDKTLPKF